MSGSSEKSAAPLRKLDSFFTRALLLVFCFFCLNFLVTYLSVSQVRLHVKSASHGALFFPRFSSWINSSALSTFSLLDEFMAAGSKKCSDLEKRAGSCARTALGDDPPVYRQTGLRMYEAPDLFKSTQVAGVYSNLCCNGSHILTLGRSVVCEEEEEQQMDEESPLRPVSCSNAARQAFLREMLVKEHGLAVDVRDEEWFLNTSASMSWQAGTSSLIYLDRSTGNCAHFVGKVNMILLMNGATIPGFQDVVERLYFVLHEHTARLWWKSSQHERGFLATYLAGVVNRVLAIFNLEQVQASHLLGNHSVVAAQGRVKIGKFPFMDASEDRPLCFEHAIVPGILKSSHYPPGRTVPDMSRELFREWLHLQTILSEEDPPVLQYIRREGQRRVFFQESDDRLVSILKAVEGFSLRSTTFNNMSFQEQFTLSQEADITISLHGANLVNPSMFSRRNAVLIELLPYHVLHRMYETQSLHSGLIYMDHQLSQGAPQQFDDAFSNLTYRECMSQSECKENFVHRRQVELPPEDLLQIQTLLGVARSVHFQLIRRGITPDGNDGPFEPALLDIIKETTGTETSCGPYLATRNDVCRNTWVAFSDGQGYPKICYLAQRCSGWVA